MNFNDIKKVFEQNENRENAIEMSRYMKDNFKFYGIPSPKRKEISKAFISDAKKSKIVDWKLLNACYKDEHRELQYFANDYLMAMNKYLMYEDIENILVYAKTKQWWDTIDFLDKIIGNIGLHDNRVNDLMIELSKCDDMWLRRLAIDHQNGRKEKTNSDLLEKIIVNNFDSKEFFINKAIGWSLRDYSKVNPEWVSDFIVKYKDKLDKLSIKEASKYI